VSRERAALEAFGLVSQRLTGYQHYGYGTSVYQPNGERETFDKIILGSRRGRAWGSLAGADKSAN